MFLVTNPFHIQVNYKSWFCLYRLIASSNLKTILLLNNRINLLGHGCSVHDRYSTSCPKHCDDVIVSLVTVSIQGLCRVVHPVSQLAEQGPQSSHSPQFIRFSELTECTGINISLDNYYIRML